jgi:hypothetical protein
LTKPSGGLTELTEIWIGDGDRSVALCPFIFPFKLVIPLPIFVSLAFRLCTGSRSKDRLQVNKTDSAVREVPHHSSPSLFWKTWLSRLSISGVGVLHETELVEKTDL